MKKRNISIIVAAVFIGIFAVYGLVSQWASHAAPANFVYRDGNKLMLNDKEYKFVGYNYFGMTGCADGSPDSQATIESYFGGLRPVSTTRTWAFQPQGLVGVDRVVAAAEKYNQKVIFALADGAQYCGDTGYGNSFYKGGYAGSYFSWIQQVVSRYKDSPAVLGWEIMNEPCHTGTSGLTKTDMRNFFDASAVQIKKYDPNHLVFTGSLAQYDCGGALSDFAYVHSGANIDGGSLHEYDWLSVGQYDASGHWNAVRSALQGIHKVAYVGEVGVGPDGSCLSDGEMANAHKRKLNAYMNANASGVLLWGIDDSKVCGLYSGRQITFNSETANMVKSYTNPNLPTPGTPTTPGDTTAPTVSLNLVIVNDSIIGLGVNQWTYGGVWQTSTGAGKYLGDDHYSNAANATATLKFAGTQLKLYGGKASHHGIMSVRIDSAAAANVDQYAAGRADQELVYTSPVLASGTHTAVITVTGTKNSSSSDTVISLDKAEVLSDSTATITGDVNGDGRVNALDLSALISHDGQNYPAADFNNDGTVGAADLAILLGKWTW